MKTGNFKSSTLIALLGLICLLFFLNITGCSQNADKKKANETPQDTANAILEQSGVKGGFIVHVNCGDGVLTEALKKNDSFMVQGLDPDMNNVTNARKYIFSKGEYGKISVDRLTENRLPYTNGMVNLIVAEGMDNIPMDEFMRVLVPNGVLMAKSENGWEKTVKPRPADLDEWNQYLYNSGNNPVSKDLAVGPPKHYQWVGSPKWGRHHDTVSSMSALVSANGRVFYIMDDGPKYSAQLPADDILVARDAYNGTILWKRHIAKWMDYLFPMKSGPAYLPRRLVATGDRVYVTLGIDAPVSELDAVTGKVLRTFPNTKETSELLLGGKTLFLVVGRPEKDKKDYTSTATYVWDRMKEANTGWAWSEKPARIMAVDMASGKEEWTKEYPVGPLSLSADKKSVYFFNGSRLVALDRKNGEEEWQSDPIKTKAYTTSYSPRLVVSDGVLVFSLGNPSGFGPGNMLAISARDGKKLWEAPQAPSGHMSPEDLFVINGLVWSGNTAWGQADGKYTGRDLHTGKVVQEFPCDANIYFFHQRCYPSKATEKYIIPSRAGIEYVDLKDQHWDINRYTRGSCFYGIMPSNGLTYTPPNACACYLETTLEGFNAFGGAFKSEPDLKKEAEKNRLEKGPAYNATITDDSNPGDWPTYRHDTERSDFTTSDVSADIVSRWDLKLGGRLSSPVVAGNRVYVAQVDEHTVYAIDRTKGNVLWKYTAGGRVDSPPTLYHGRVLFGSADGYVYCLDSANGELAWRFRAAPMDRRMMAFEQVESVWPVHGSVLVLNDKIYCVAGRSLYLDGGMRMLQLDPKTGKKLSENIMDQIDPQTGKNMLSTVQGLDMAVGLSDVLSSDGSHIYMRSQQFDLDGKRTYIGVRNVKDQSGEGAHIFSPTGFLDENNSQFYRTYMMYGKAVHGGWGGWEVMGKVTPSGRIIAVGNDTVYGFSRKPQFYAESIVQDYQIYAAKTAGSKEAIAKITAPPKPPVNAFDKGLFNYAGDWKLREGLPEDEQTAVQYKWKIDTPPLRVRAMFVADKTIFVAGPPVIMSEEKAFYGLDKESVRKELAEQATLLKGKDGSVIWALDAKTGKKLAEYKMNSMPVLDGMIAAQNSIYMTTTNGDVICYSAGKGI